MNYPVYYDGEIVVTPQLTAHDVRVLLAVTNLEQDENTKAIFEAIKVSPEPDLPWHGGLIVVSEGGTSILPEEDESRPGFCMWIVLLVEHFFTPRGYLLNGDVSWTANDDDYDRGSLFVKDNEVEVIDDLIHNGGPSWNPSPYADASIKQSIQKLVESADSAGCSPDLTVVATAPLDALRALLAKV